MPSIIEGYNYDIFISYRQKDNKGEKWVSTFVEQLKGELESTFKEEISVYFDINPHDGLLEMHDVDESLKEKLKCLIFIPIISRTYCDPKSYAWEHEFKSFVEKASNDQFGMKVKLKDGNVASRVLPVQIHDLDREDKKTIESVIGGVLRSIEFIYKEAGIDKPLDPDDAEETNLNATKYRIQIIKVAHAIKEIIHGLKNEIVHADKEPGHTEESLKVTRTEVKTDRKQKPSLRRISKIFYAIAFAAIIVISGILVYPKISSRSSLEKLRLSGEKITVVVMPFQNMTNDTTWNIWQSGIQDMLITNLSNASDELKVRQLKSINGLIESQGSANYASITPTLGNSISRKLDANLYIYGNIKQAGTVMRVNARLVDSRTGDVLKSFQIESSSREGNIFQVTDSLSGMVRDFLIISRLIKKGNPDFAKYGASTKYPEALKLVLNGNNVFNNKFDYIAAIDYYMKAIAVDSTYLWPAIMISYSYLNLGSYVKGKEWCRKIYDKRDQMPLYYKTYTNIMNAYFNETPYEAIKYFRQLLETDDQLPDVYGDIGTCYSDMGEYSKAIPEYEKSLEIYEKWGTKPVWVFNYIYLGNAYHRTGQYKKEEKLYKKAEEDFPGDVFISYNQALLQLAEKDTTMANKYIERLFTYARESSWSDANTATGAAGFYSSAGCLDKAEMYYRQALSSEPESPEIINNLAWFLINNDRNIDEGLNLIEKILKTDPYNYIFLHNKGWGLYKQGRYNDALETLQKSWDLRRKLAIYNHTAYLHLEAAKEAAGSQKYN